MSLVKTSVNRPVTVWMFTFAVVLFGMVSWSRLPINLLPELSYPTLTIRTAYTGAAPAEVEQLVSKPIEEAIGVVKGVHTVTSTSKAEQSDVVLEFEWGTDMDLAGLEVREKLDILQLPLDVDKPLLLRFDPTLDPVIRLGLGSNEQGDLKSMRIYAEEQVKRKLESVSGVASVRVGGGLENEIQILMDQQKTNQLAIDIEEVITRIRSENVNTSGGRIEDGSQDYLVRTLNQFDSLSDIENVFVANREGRNIRLGDIAQISNGHKERTTLTRFDSFEGVEIAIYKEGDANTVMVSDRIRNRITEIEATLPDQYQLNLVYDQSQFIENAISEVKSAAIVGGLLAMVILYFFLKNIWATLIISLSIPVSIIATFNLMYGNDISLNIMSLGGIALAVGLLVDNSIVVLENIDRARQQHADLSLLECATKGTQQVSMAIVASTLTTMAVFFPLVFVEGVAGQLFRDQALTVTFALGASLIVALTLIPMLASREKRTQSVDIQLDSSDQQKAQNQTVSTFKKIANILTWPIQKLFQILFVFIPFSISAAVIFIYRLMAKLLGVIFKPVLFIFDKSYGLVERLYQGMLIMALRARVLVVTIITGSAVVSLLLLPKLGVELIPSMSQGEFYVEVTLPNGSPLDATDNVLKALSEFTHSLTGVERTYSLAGTGSLMNTAPGQGGDHWGKLNVVLSSNVSETTRKEIIDEMRNFLSQKAGIYTQFGEPELFSFDSPLAVEITGYDLTELRRHGDRLSTLMADNPRFTDVQTSLKAGNPEIKIQFDHALLAQLNLDAPNVSKLIAAKVGGEIASQFSMDDRKIDILVRTQDDQRDSVSDISQLIVNPGATPSIPLSAIASISRSIGPSEITRVGQQRVVIISANLAYGDLGEGVKAAKTTISALKLPATMNARVTGQSEDMDASFTSLKFALALAIFMVYLVMASQFESLLHPFLILFTVPLAAAGSIYGLYITDTHISVVVFIGLIMLAGIVVNNAIVLVDRINQLRHDGMEKTQAIVTSAQSRLRPIVMTTLSTILGLLPLALSTGEGAEVRAPMAITVIFGLLFASSLTLLLIPVLYSLLDRKHFKNTEKNPVRSMAEQGQPHYG